MTDHRTPAEIIASNILGPADRFDYGQATPSRHQPSRKAVGRLAPAIAAIRLVEALDPAGALGDEALDVALGVLDDARMSVEARLSDIADGQPF